MKTKYGIGQERLTVITVNETGDSWGSSVEAWIVPKGGTLPDPFAVEKDEEENEEP